MMQIIEPAERRNRPGVYLAMPTPPTPLFRWRHPAQDTLQAQLNDFVSTPGFPCVGAKAALGRGTLAVLACNRLDSGWDDLRIHDGLITFAAAYRSNPTLFRSFAVIFEGPDKLTEQAFERHLWERAQSLSDKDVWRGQAYDDSVSSDPDSPHFSMSFGGEAFFIVGLHPGASRPARRFDRPAMVFNLHDQFELLRDKGKYENMRSAILGRDEVLAGSRNPMLARHGESSEARQYSGRAVDADWSCPFRYSGHPSE